MSCIFHITGCVVQAAAAKAKKVSDEKQFEDLDQAQKDEGKKNDDSETNNELGRRRAHGRFSKDKGRNRYSRGSRRSKGEGTGGSK